LVEGLPTLRIGTSPMATGSTTQSADSDLRSMAAHDSMISGSLRQRDGESSKRITARRLVIAIGALGLVLVVLSESYLVFSNKSRADRWQARSAALERNVDGLNRLLVMRSSQLNARTRELNRMGHKVRKEQQALKRSQADVSQLARRQRELANEKAQVEDSRAGLVVQAAALEGVSSAFANCKDGLVDLLDYVLNDDYVSAEAIVDSVGSECQYAENSLADYRASYG
jgi:hypothetical protein